MPANPVKIGPFVGGLNTYSGPASIADNEAVDILNMDIDLDGSLSSRPGVDQFDASAGSVGISHILATYRSTTDIVYIIFAHDNAAYAYNVSTATVSVVQTGQYTAAVQYADKLWLVLRPSGAAVGGGKWDPVGGYVAVAAMPRGMSATIYKERMWIAGSRNNDQTSMNRLKFSAPGNPDSWTATDTLDVAGGDGEDIQKIIVFDSAIAVFKSDSTYVLAYDSSPTKAQVQKVAAIGANNRFSVVEYENNLFVFHETKVYRISNWNWEHANIKIPFQYVNVGGATPENGTSLSILNNRIIARFYDNYYSLGLKTGAWSRWSFLDGLTPSEFMADPNVDPVHGTNIYYAGSTSTDKKYYRFIDKPLYAEQVEINLQTKDYDFGPSYGFKRLFWWGADLLTKSPTDFYVQPVVYSTAVTWGQVGSVLISALGTWGRPLDLSLNVSDSADGSNPIGYRTFIKLLKGLRFRQVSFRLNSVVDASGDPYRIFSLTAFVDNKEQVSKKVS